MFRAPAGDDEPWKRPPVVTHPARWRLDQLIVWEDRGMAVAAAALEAPVAPRRKPSIVADLLPRPCDVDGWRKAAVVARGSRPLAPGPKLPCRI